MWLFNKRYSLAESGILQGLTEYHCHILPGVDDGVQTMEDSIQLLSMYEDSGIREIWLTPHIMEDMPNETNVLKDKFHILKSTYSGQMILRLSAENMLDNVFEKRLAANDIFTIVDGNHLLVETSYYNPPMALDNILQRIKAKGYTPILAHPERYQYMEKEDYIHLKENNIQFQLNLPSLVCAYGSNVENKAKALLKNGFYDFLGTDTHSINSWDYMIHAKCLSKDTISNIEALKK